MDGMDNSDIIRVKSNWRGAMTTETDILEGLEKSTAELDAKMAIARINLALKAVRLLEQREERRKKEQAKESLATFLTNISASIAEFAEKDMPDDLFKKYPRAFMSPKELAEIPRAEASKSNPQKNIKRIEKMLQLPAHVNYALLLEEMDGRRYDAEELKKVINAKSGGRFTDPFYPHMITYKVINPLQPKKLGIWQNFIKPKGERGDNVAPELKKLLLARIEKEAKEARKQYGDAYDGTIVLSF